MITDEDIIKYTLQHLDGWEITTEDTSVVNESAYMSEEELQRNANKYISTDEILLEFEVNKKSDSCAEFTIHETEETLEKFPFKFTFNVYCKRNI